MLLLLERSLWRISEADRHSVVGVHQADRDREIHELAAIRRWSASYGRPDESCADPADIPVNIAILETSLLIKSLMSHTQGERIRNDQHSKLIQRNLEGDLRTHSTQYAGGCRDHSR